MKSSLRLLLPIVLTTVLPQLVTADFTTRACFTVEGEPIVGATVKCWDSDWGTDDVVGPEEGVLTNDNGCVEVFDDNSWWEDPDVYCKIISNGDCFATFATYEWETDSNTDVDFGYFDLTYDPDYCGDFGYASNGCGPDSFPDWLNDVATSVSGFATQCAAHDNCYADCQSTRSNCDIQFEADMYNQCAGSWTCEILASLFYEAVDAGGEEACIAARHSCGSTRKCSK